MPVFLYSSLCFDLLHIESKENPMLRTKFLCNKELMITSTIDFNYSFVQVAIGDRFSS